MVDRVKQGITIDDLMAFGEDAFIEIIDGEIVPKGMSAGFVHVYFGLNLYDILKPYIKKHQLGILLTDGLTYVLYVDQVGVRTSRIPDLSFIRRDKFKPDFDPERPFFGAPALAVEVVSPHEPTADTLAKISDFLRYGSEQVWVLYPKQRELHVYLSDNTPPQVYGAEQTFTPAALFPGLTIPVADLFVMDEA